MLDYESLKKTNSNRIVESAFRQKKVKTPSLSLKRSAVQILQEYGISYLLKWIDTKDCCESRTSVHILDSYSRREKNKESSGFIFDISDIVNYFSSGHKTVTGIQRLILATLATFSCIEKNSNKLISFSSFPYEGAKEISWDFIDHLTNKILQLNEEESEPISDIICKNSIKIDQSWIDSHRGVFHTLLIMGAAWIVPAFPKAHYAIASELELYVTTILYDLIPYSHPEYVSGDAAREFYTYINSLLSISDIVIPISEYVANDLIMHSDSLLKNIYKKPVVKPITLAREIPFKPNKSLDLTEINHKALKKGVEVNNFVLNVGSIDIRKNHIGSFVAWRHLKSRLGMDCPQLVIVGRRGWKSEPFFDEMLSTNNLDNKIVVLEDVDDNFLSFLYTTCRFTIYPSLEEGWGLPIGESLDAEKLCLTSKKASMPEVGGDLCKYIDPYNYLDIAREVELLLEKKEEIKIFEQKIRKAKPLKSWIDYKKEILNTIEIATKDFDKPINTLPVSNYIIYPEITYLLCSHLNESSYRKEDGLSNTVRSIYRIAPAKLITSSGLDFFDIDGAWCLEPKIKISCFIELDEREIKNQLKSLNFLLHYHLSELVQSFSELKSFSKIKIHPNIQIFNGDEWKAHSLNSLFILKSRISYISIDVVGFTFDLPDSLIKITEGAKLVRVPISLEFNWDPIFKFNCMNQSKLKTLKVKEFKFNLE